MQKDIDSSKMISPRILRKPLTIIARTQLILGILIISTGLTNYLVVTNDLGSKAKVINQTGVVRGRSQYLFKSELAGRKSDGIIYELNILIAALRQGNNELHINPISDEYYQDKLKTIEQEWNEIKTLIYEYREDSSKKQQLLAKSDTFWELCDSAVALSERVVRDEQNLIRNLQIFMLTIKIIILIIFGTILLSILQFFKRHGIEPNKLITNPYISDDNE